MAQTENEEVKSLTTAETSIASQEDDIERIFHKYKKDEGKTTVLFLYLVLNGYDMEKVSNTHFEEEEQGFGLKFKRLVGETTEYVDTQSIDNDIMKLHVPSLCPLTSYEMNSNSEIIYVYSADVSDRPLYINDMGIISPLMSISSKYIVSSNKAASVENSKNKGFMHFVEYVLKNECRVGIWHIVYDSNNEEFNIYNCYTKDGEYVEATVYNAKGMDKAASYRLVLYVITKTIGSVDEFPPDNFKEEVYRK